MTLWRTYYHIVWATHDRLPLITPDREPHLYQQIQHTIQILDAQCHAIGGMPDHIHLIVSIPPKISISQFVKQIKGSSARYINQSESGLMFAWQREYSIFSLGSQQTDRAIDRINMLSVEQLESLGEDLLDFGAVDELMVWLEKQG